jgi:catechol 2,3-dioxygenase-like lactoylglutathione lyase family enzyme
MACRITELVLDCVDPERLAAFWGEVLGWTVVDREGKAVEIGSPESQITIVFDVSDQPKTGKLRLHLDVDATDRDQAAELDRLLAAGARPADIGQTGEESWYVLQDPEGNEFCLLRRQAEPV